MARRENFFLDTRGGAYVLQVMAYEQVLAIETAQANLRALQARINGISATKTNDA